MGQQQVGHRRSGRKADRERKAVPLEDRGEIPARTERTSGCRPSFAGAGDSSFRVRQELVETTR
jgi:hypothetical protein